MKIEIPERKKLVYEMRIPIRWGDIRNKLNLGKSVQFMDWRTGQMRSSKVVAIKDSQPCGLIASRTVQLFSS